MTDAARATRQRLTLSGRATTTIRETARPSPTPASDTTVSSTPRAVDRDAAQARTRQDPIDSLLAPVRESLNLCDKGNASLEAFTRMLLSGGRTPGRA